MDQFEKETAVQLQAEHGIPEDWSVSKSLFSFRLLDSPYAASEALAKLTGHDSKEIQATLSTHTDIYELPEGTLHLTYKSPDGERKMLITASPRDMRRGSKSYLARLDLDQLLYVHEHAGERIKQIRAEAKRTVWRVVDTSLCFGNFREEDYLGAVACMAEEARKLYEENKDDVRECPRALKISIEPMRLPQSEYDDWFKQDA